MVREDRIEVGESGLRPQVTVTTKSNGMPVFTHDDPGGAALQFEMVVATKDLDEAMRLARRRVGPFCGRPWRPSKRRIRMSAEWKFVEFTLLLPDRKTTRFAIRPEVVEAVERRWPAGHSGMEALDPPPPTEAGSRSDAGKMRFSCEIWRMTT